MNESLLPGPIRCHILAASLLTLVALPAAAGMEFDAARLNEIAARLRAHRARRGWVQRAEER